ncbi:MAG: SatD family protein [Pseudobdellovibrio sp.]|nr:SatD family protein [Pseudobdellovibrio sp.]
MKKTTVLIGDIDASKKIATNSRNQIQKKLDNAFTKLNKELAEHLLSPLLLTIGDEFQAVTKSPLDMWILVKALNNVSHELGIRFRFAISHGELLTSINRQAPLKMDGPAFWKARELIEQKNRRYNFSIEGDPLNSTLMTLGFALEEIENGWTKVQTQYVSYLLNEKNRNSSDVARRFDKNPSTIHRMLKKTHLDLYKEAQHEISYLLEGYKIRCQS